jgi:hypothetical protein
MKSRVTDEDGIELSTVCRRLKVRSSSYPIKQLKIQKMKITKTAVDKLAIPPTAQAGKTAQKRYYDDTIKGFGVRVTSGGTKAFFIEKLIKKKLCRITLGRYPELTVEMAKKEAQKLLGQIAMVLTRLPKNKRLRCARCL